jgi:hypothetical protein
MAPSLTRGRVCNSLSALSPVGLKTTFIVPIFETPPTSVAGSRIYIPQGQGIPVIPRSLSVASYDSQGYGGGIRTYVHNYKYICNCDSLIIGKFTSSLYVYFVKKKNRLLYEACCSSNDKAHVSQFHSCVLPSVASSHVDKY